MASIIIGGGGRLTVARHLPSFVYLAVVWIAVDSAKLQMQQKHLGYGGNEDLSLFIDEQQVKMYSGKIIFAQLTLEVMTRCVEPMKGQNCAMKF